MEKKWSSYRADLPSNYIVLLTPIKPESKNALQQFRILLYNQCPPSEHTLVGCLKIIKDKSPKSRVPNSRRRAKHCSTKTRGSKPASQPALQHQGAWVETRVSASTAAPRREGRNPRLSQHCSTKARGSKPASQRTAAPRRVGRHPRLSCNRPGYRVNHGPHNGES